MPTVAHRKLFYDRAYASAAEVDTFAELAFDLGFLMKEQYEKLLEQINKASFLVQKLSQSNHTLNEVPTLPTLPTQASRNHEQASAH